jgi:hypothetical protein
MDRPSHLKAHEAAGCNISVTNTRRKKPKIKDKEKRDFISKRRRSSSSESDESIVSHAFSTESYNCDYANCLETFTSETGFALHMAMHVVQAKNV